MTSSEFIALIQRSLNTTKDTTITAFAYQLIADTLRAEQAPAKTETKVRYFKKAQKHARKLKHDFTCRICGKQDKGVKSQQVCRTVWCRAEDARRYAKAYHEKKRDEALVNQEPVTTIQ
jgi:hypothetical protein